MLDTKYQQQVSIKCTGGEQQFLTEMGEATTAKAVRVQLPIHSNKHYQAHGIVVAKTSRHP